VIDSAVGAEDAGPHPLAKLFWVTLVRFGKILLNLGKIKAKYGQK